MKEKRSFRYVLADAWENIILQVDVIKTRKERTVRCLYFEANRMRSKETTDTACLETPNSPYKGPLIPYKGKEKQ